MEHLVPGRGQGRGRRSCDPSEGPGCSLVPTSAQPHLPAAALLPPWGPGPGFPRLHPMMAGEELLAPGLSLRRVLRRTFCVKKLKTGLGTRWWQPVLGSTCAELASGPGLAGLPWN